MDDARTRLEWLVKTAPHRSVAPALSNGGGGASAGEQLLQRRIDPPYLIDGRAWDLGVYVGFQRHDDGSLTTTIHDDVLLRFCTSPFISTDDAHRALAAAKP